MPSNKVIVLSGSHRSGSTWAGKMIALSSEVYYIDEPLNPGRKHFKSPLDIWFVDPHYQTSEKQAIIKKYLLNVLYTKIFYIIFNLKQNLFRKRRQFITKFPERSKELVLNIYKIFLNKTIPIIKDPISLFALEWLSEFLNLKVIILIRHPAAFIASTKVAKWDFDMNELLNQEKLLETQFLEYKEEINRHIKENKSLLENNILAWKVFHHRIYQYKSKQPNWYFITHEKLSLNPTKEFKKIFDYLELSFDESIEKKIRQFTSGNKLDSIHRDSKKNIFAWKNRLTKNEILKIKNETSGLWQKFYDENDW